jgi:hypothetical protein
MKMIVDLPKDLLHYSKITPANRKTIVSAQVAKDPTHGVFRAVNPFFGNWCRKR